MELTDLSAAQRANALAIYRAAVPFGQDAVMAALMAAATESSFLTFANNGLTERDDVPPKWRTIAALSMRFPHDAVAGQAWTTADSVGLFQQRPMFDYCTPDLDGVGQLMDPFESTRIFLRGSHGGTGRTRYFLQAPQHFTVAQRVQWAQGSEFPTGENYAVMTTVATQLVAQFRATGEPAADGAADITDWITMADQQALDAQWDRIADKVDAKADATVRKSATDPNIMALQNTSLFAQDTGLGMSFAAQLALMLTRLEKIEQALSQRVA